MFRILIIDDNVKFILKVQKMLPSGSEWIASVDNDRIQKTAWLSRGKQEWRV